LSFISFWRLKQLKQNGLTILLVEQNVHLALALIDYAYVIEGGTSPRVCRQSSRPSRRFGALT
jgi:ABC-type branched-subunit amino acid transport system ATPase component